MGVIWEPKLSDRQLRWRDLSRELSRTRFAEAAASIDEEQRYPWEHVELLASHGFTSMFTPEEFGGSGESLVSVTAVLEEISRTCSNTALVLSAYVTGAFPILLAGTAEQKRRYIPELVKGTGMAFALTERGSGSDAAAARTTATRVAGGWRIQGEKSYVGNGGASKYYMVFARTVDETGEPAKGLTAFVVEKDQPGVIIDRYENKMGGRGTLTSNLKLDVTVPEDVVLGTPGKGLNVALSALTIGRISISAIAVGLGLGAFDAATLRAHSRTTFGQPLLANQGISFRLADAATELSAARLLTYESARMWDDGEDIRLIGAMTKLFTTEATHRVVDTAVQVFGAEGYVKPSSVERNYRDARMLEIVEGASEIQRLIISRALVGHAAELAAGTARRTSEGA